MRRRWRVHEDFWQNIAAGWFGFGFIGLVVVLALNHDGSTAGQIAAVVWVAPLGIAAAVLIVGGFAYSLGWVWTHRPRRVAEPLTEDLRAVALREDSR